MQCRPGSHILSFKIHGCDLALKIEIRKEEDNQIKKKRGIKGNQFFRLKIYKLKIYCEKQIVINDSVN